MKNPWNGIASRASSMQIEFLQKCLRHVSPLNLVDGRFPRLGITPRGAEGSSLLCRLSICLSTCVYVTRTDPLDNNCLLRSGTARVVRSFKPFGHNFVRTVVCQFRFVHHRFSTRFSYSEILLPSPPLRRHCSQSVESIFFFPTPRFFDETL